MIDGIWTFDLQTYIREQSLVRYGDLDLTKKKNKRGGGLLPPPPPHKKKARTIQTSILG